MYVYYTDPNTGQWVIANSAPASTTAIVADTAPISPGQGELWFDSVNAKLYLWYVDNNSGQWVQINS
jgi:hypothetical protein